MAWKDWSAVKKGAVGGLIVGSGLFLLGVIYTFTLGWGNMVGLFFLFPTVKITSIFYPEGSHLYSLRGMFVAVFFAALSIPIYSGIGALFGKIGRQKS